mmetsp:Transcript_149090/g.277852  ORF Transcript_149090/g.277852 Transcript_149090/m.277852 type:complete len:235 (+) Transcript_149090:1-705(+)
MMGEPPMNPLMMEMAASEDVEGMLKAPKMPGASPIGELADPLGVAMSPHLTTPAWGPAPEGATRTPAGGRGSGILGGLSQVDQWAWEVGSEAGSMPSVWSAATTSVQSSSLKSRIATATGDGLIPGLIEGQRLSYVKPTSVPTAGGRVVVGLRKQVPQGFWERIGIVMVNGPKQVKLKPTGIKKGKKLCIEVPPGLALGDYDVRLSFDGKILHGAIPLAIRDGEEVEDEVDDED